MRLLFCVTALNLIRWSASTCAAQPSNGDWYLDVMFCAYTSTTYSTLTACQSAGAGTGTPWSSGPTADAGFTGAGGEAPCQACIQAFYTSVRAPITAGTLGSCGASSYDSATVGSYSCLLALYADINTFNTCALTGGRDVVTGIVSKRCTYDEFTALERDFLPYASMIGSVKASVPASPSSGYRARVSAGFSARLTAVPCGACYDTLYTSLVGASITTPCTSVHGDTCLNAVRTILNTHAVCTGGFRLHTDAFERCNSTEQDMIDTVYRPYQGLLACSHYKTLLQTSQLTSCLSGYSGFEEAPSVGCIGCFDTLIPAMDDQKINSCSPFYSSGTCTDSMSDVYGALTEFSVCAGFSLTTSATQCTSVQWSGAADILKSYVTLLIEGVRMGNAYGAIDLIEGSVYLADIKAARSGLTCASCYDAFLADVYTAYSGSVVVQADCANPYSGDCYLNDDIRVARTRFKTCSGYDLLNVFWDRCTAAEATAMGEYRGVVSGLLLLGLISTTAAQVSTGFGPLMLQLGAQKVSTKCQFCYWNLVKSLYDLSSIQKTACTANWDSTTCQSTVSAITAAFKSCSGIELSDLLPEVTTSTTSTTTLSTTTETTSSVATTTTKAFKHSLQVAAAVLLLILLN
jgi:hypothetical protein